MTPFKLHHADNGHIAIHDPPTSILRHFNVMLGTWHEHSKDTKLMLPGDSVRIICDFVALLTR